MYYISGRDEKCSCFYGKYLVHFYGKYLVQLCDWSYARWRKYVSAPCHLVSRCTS